MAIGSAAVLSYHAGLLGDHTRLDAYKRAIDATVRPGDVVIDVGTGSGVLSAFACMAGAARVYAIEEGSIAALAGDLLSANGFADRVHLLRSHSSLLELPERADVLVSETLWNFGLGEGLPAAVRDLRERALVPDARIVPRRFQMMTAPVHSERLWKKFVGFWGNDVAGLALGPGRELAANNLYICDVAAEDLLGSGQPVGGVDLMGHDIAQEVFGSATWHLEEPATVHGLAGWFEADLAPGISLTSPPGISSSWTPVFLPIDPPLVLTTPGRLDVSFEFYADGREIRWRVETADGCRTHSTFRGRLLDAGWIQRRSPATQAGLSKRGRAASAVLHTLANGGTIADADRILAEAHAALFPTEPDRTDFLEALVESFCT